MLLRTKVKSVLLIDYDNVTPFFKQEKLAGRVGNWLSWLEDGQFDPSGRKREFLLKKVFWHKRYAEEQPAFEHYAFKTETCVYAAGGKKGQSAVDLHLAMDAIEATRDLKGVQEMIILASDSDYMPLIEKLKARGLKSAIIVSQRDASRLYNGKADFTISEDDLRAALSYVRSKGNQKPPVAAKPAKAASVSKATQQLVPGGPFDLNRAAELVANVLVHRGGKPLGLRDVGAALQSEPAFAGDRTWLGLTTFEAFATEIAKRDQRVAVGKTPTGAITIELAATHAS